MNPFIRAWERIHKPRVISVLYFAFVAPASVIA